ncbi:MAG: 4-hydroxylaminobenzoate lyase, partial [Planctomycetota bacterium]
MQPNAASLAPLLKFAAGLDLSDPAAARASLEQEFPFDGEAVQLLRASMVAALEAGEICNHGEDPLRYSRVFKQSEETLMFSADAVLMNGAGPKHRHPEGEIDLCFSLDGDPRFDGKPEGWVVYGPMSVHIPTV